MFVKVESHCVSPGDIQRRSSFTRSVFQCVRILLFVGGVNPGKSVFSKEKSLCTKLRKTYIIVVVLLYLMILAPFCFDIYKKHTEAKDIAVALAYLILFAFTVYLTIINSWTLPKLLPTLEESFDSYDRQYTLNKDVSKMPRNLKIITVVFMLFIYGIYPFQLASLKMYPLLMCQGFPTCSIPYPWQDVVFSLNVLAYTILFAGWQVFFVVCVYFSLFFIREFRAISKRFKDLSTFLHVSVQTETRLDELISHYESLVEILNGTNDCVQHYSFASVFMSLPIHCSFLYAALDKNLKLVEILYLCLGISFSLCLTGVRLLFQASVSSKAQEPLQYLWKMKKDNLSDRVLQKLNLFISRLTGDSIGFCIYGLLTINMPTLLAIFGTLATYVIIAIQFYPKDNPSQCDLLTKNITYCLAP